jgi:hypothetical protein
MMSRRLGLAAVGQLIGLAQHPVETRFRGDVAATVSEYRDDLARGHAGKLRLIGDRQDLAALVLRGLIGRLSLLGGLLAAIGLHLTLLTPALQGAR